MIDHRKKLGTALALSLAGTLPALAEMTLTLPGTHAGAFGVAQEQSGFGCSGGNLSPEIIWSGAPAATGSYILTLYDPDAPTGSGFWHWSVFNIPATVTRLVEGAGASPATMPAGSVAARNDLSRNLYDGPCPPEGSTHGYVVTLYAMPTTSIPLDETASSALVGYFANASALAKASVRITYGR